MKSKQPFISPELFRQRVLIEARGRVRPFGQVIEPWQAADFAALDPAWLAVTGRGPIPPVRRAWLERPRGHSKTGDIAMSSVWALATSERRLTGVVAAADRDQARFISTAVEGLLNLNPELEKYIEVQRDRVVNRTTGSEMQILSSDVASSFGLTPDFIVLDEVTHWANRDLWNSLFSAVAKKEKCLLLCIQNAGFQDSWQWHLREEIKNDPGWHFCSLDGPRASWITTDALVEQRKLLPTIAYQRLWLNRWSTGSGDAIDDELLRAAIKGYQPLQAATLGHQFYAGLDVGQFHDSTALVILSRHVGHWQPRAREDRPMHPHAALLLRQGLIDPPEETEPESEWIPGDGRLRLAACKIWRPEPGRPVSLSQVSAETLELFRAYGFSLCFDPSQAMQMAEDFFSAGMLAERVTFGGPNSRALCQVMLEAFGNKALDLYDDPDLIADIRAQRVKETPGGGGVVLTAPRNPRAGKDQPGTAHADSATGLSLALLAAQRHAHACQPARVQGGLLCWP